MRWIAEVRERLGATASRARADAEMDEEMRFHIDMQTEANLRAGMSPEEARRRARIAFGGMETHRAEVRDARGLGIVEVLARDVRCALRGLRLHPVFSVTLVLTLALGVGATAAMFGVLDALLLRPLPYQEPQRLVQAQVVTAEGGVGPYLSWEQALHWRKEEGVFESAMVHSRRTLLFTGGPEPLTVIGEGVTPEFEAVLGVRAALGRGLREEDAAPGAPGVVLLSHDFWRGTLGADPDAVGASIELGGERHRVVGVMPAGFKFPEYATTELWLPIRSDGTLLGAPAGRLSLVGRLGAGPLEVAQARADAAAGAFAEREAPGAAPHIRLQPLDARRAANPQVREPVWFLSGAVLLILLVSVLNATSLLLVRGWGRARELGIRLAVGGSPRRLVARLVVESAVIALLSGLAAAVLAVGTLRAVRGIVPASITFFAPYPIEVGWRALAFSLVVALGAGTFAGLLAALRVVRAGGAPARTSLTPYAVQTAAHGRLLRMLIAGEVAVSVVLLIGAALLVHSFVRLSSVDPGYRTDGVAVMRLQLAETSYPSGAARAEFLRRLEQRLEALPGVTGVAVNAGVPPVGGFSFGVRLEPEEGEPPAAQPTLLPFAAVTPSFFAVLDVPLVAGRALDARDVGTDHAVIDLALARSLWGSADVLGRRFRTAPDAPWLTVVGVTGELRMMGPDDRNARFGILHPLTPDEIPAYVPLAIRTRGDPRPLLPSMRAAVHDLDPRQPIQELRSANELYAATIDMPRFLLVLTSLLSAFALLLAAVGIYGVVAFAVAQRRGELGIRIALGAPVGRLARSVLADGIRLSTIGVTVGVATALLLSRWIESVLFGVAPTDPATIGTVAAISLATAAAASYAPARRAARTNPLEVIRAE